MNPAEESLAGKVMEEAIELNIEGRSPYPDKAWFIDAGCPQEAHWVKHAFDEGFAVVLVSADRSTCVLRSDSGTAPLATQPNPARSLASRPSASTPSASRPK